MLGPILILVASLIGKISIVFPIVFICLYILFVIVVILSDKFSKKVQAEDSDTDEDTEASFKVDLLLDGEEDVVHKEHNDDHEDLNNDGENEAMKEVVQNGAINYSLQGADDNRDKKKTPAEPRTSPSLTDHIKEDHFSDHSGDEEEEDGEKKGDFLQQKSSLRLSFEKTKHDIVWSMVKMRGFLHKSVSPEESWKEMNIFQKVIYLLVDIPFDFLRRITIPPGSEEAWDRRFACVSPVFGVIYFYITAGIIKFTGVPHFTFWIFLGIGLIISLLIWKFTKQFHAPDKLLIVFLPFSHSLWQSCGLDL
jgi:Ca2+/Na+ antiporter